jgi:hypothetical protein
MASKHTNTFQNGKNGASSKPAVSSDSSQSKSMYDHLIERGVSEKFAKMAQEASEYVNRPDRVLAEIPSP